MNKDRRSELERAKTMIEAAAAIVRDSAEGERQYYDDMPENMQAGEKGERADEVATSLEEQADALDEAVTAIDEACQ